MAGNSGSNGRGKQKDEAECMEKFYERKKEKEIHVPLLFGAQGEKIKRKKLKRK